MRIKKIRAINYRSLEDVEIEFNPYYNALSGKNNCGKSNIIKTILSFLTYDMRMFASFKNGPINYASDFPYWKTKEKTKESIQIEISIELDKENDAGIFKFIKELIFKDDEISEKEKETLHIKAEHKHDNSNTIIDIYFGDVKIVDEYKREELLNRLRSSESIIFQTD